jgi:hypothetical protein
MVVIDIGLELQDCQWLLAFLESLAILFVHGLEV